MAATLLTQLRLLSKRKRRRFIREMDRTLAQARGGATIGPDQLGAEIVIAEAAALWRRIRAQAKRDRRKK